MKILIVEDEKKIADSLKKGLQQENHIVDVSYDGTAGFDLASSEKYDLIILDLMFPGMDGWTICKNLRSEEKVDTPILMLTARGSVDDKVIGLNAGADDYLTKPFAFEELLARIRALTRRPRASINDTLKVHDLELNPTSFQVKRGDISLHISNKEFALLEYLMRNADKILTKDQIIAHVWNYDADILPNTIEVYIRKLRNKIDLPFPDKMQLIQTVRGFGYKITT